MQFTAIIIISMFNSRIFSLLLYLKQFLFPVTTKLNVSQNQCLRCAFSIVVILFTTWGQTWTGFQLHRWFLQFWILLPVLQFYISHMWYWLPFSKVSVFAFRFCRTWLVQLSLSWWLLVSRLNWRPSPWSSGCWPSTCTSMLSGPYQPTSPCTTSSSTTSSRPHQWSVAFCW